MDALVSRPWESVVYLSLSGSPALGVTAASVTVKYRKAGATSFQTRVAASPDWIELGSGYYVIKWYPADLDTLGVFFFVLTGAGFDNQIFGEFTVDPIPLPLMVPPNTCIVAGNIRDLGGNPAVSNQIVIRGSDYPMESGGSLITSDLIRTIPDSFGNFAVALMRGEVVIIEIERAGIRNQITIPDQSTAQLLDLLPPI